MNVSKDITDLAEYIAEEGSTSSVVFPENILKEEGVTIVCGDFKGAFDGLLEWRKGRFYTYCNLENGLSTSTPRVRFTLAHEAGHYFIDHHRNALKQGIAPSHASFYGFKSDLFIEREADAFASHLLMPSKRIVRDSKRLPKGFDAIKKLANKYRTSLTSTAIRYLDIVLNDAVLVNWDLNKTIAWTCYSEESSPQFSNTIRADYSALAKRAATRRLIADQVSDSNAIIQSGSVASSWFSGIHPGWSHDTILIEQAISLGRYGWLTLLWPE